MKIIHKLSIKLILLQILFLYFFSQAADRFYYSVNCEIMECFYTSDPDLRGLCFEKYPGYNLSDLFSHPIYYMLLGLLIAMIIDGILNWKRKVYFLNTVIVCVLYIVLHLTGFFRFTRDLDSLLISFGRIFSDKFWVMNLITFQIHLLSAILMIWLSLKSNALKKEK
nr:hypothetical protein [uncultured Fluviicola sp.]